MTLRLEVAPRVHKRHCCRPDFDFDEFYDVSSNVHVLEMLGYACIYALKNVRYMHTFVVYKSTKYALRRRKYAPKIYLTQITQDFGAFRHLSAIIECRTVFETIQGQLQRETYKV